MKFRIFMINYKFPSKNFWNRKSIGRMYSIEIRRKRDEFQYNMRKSANEKIFYNRRFKKSSGENQVNAKFESLTGQNNMDESEIFFMKPINDRLVEAIDILHQNLTNCINSESLEVDVVAVREIISDDSSEQILINDILETNIVETLLNLLMNHQDYAFLEKEKFLEEIFWILINLSSFDEGSHYIKYTRKSEQNQEFNQILIKFLSEDSTNVKINIFWLLRHLFTDDSDYTKKLIDLDILKFISYELNQEDQNSYEYYDQSRNLLSEIAFQLNNQNLELDFEQNCDLVQNILSLISLIEEDNGLDISCF